MYNNSHLYIELIAIPVIESEGSENRNVRNFTDFTYGLNLRWSLIIFGKELTLGLEDTLKYLGFIHHCQDWLDFQLCDCSISWDKIKNIILSVHNPFWPTLNLNSSDVNRDFGSFSDMMLRAANLKVWQQFFFM